MPNDASHFVRSVTVLLTGAITSCAFATVDSRKCTQPLPAVEQEVIETVLIDVHRSNARVVVSRDVDPFPDSGPERANQFCLAPKLPATFILLEIPHTSPERFWKWFHSEYLGGTQLLEFSRPRFSAGNAEATIYFTQSDCPGCGKIYRVQLAGKIGSWAVLSATLSGME